MGMIWQNAECWSTNEFPSINDGSVKKRKNSVRYGNKKRNSEINRHLRESLSFFPFLKTDKKKKSRIVSAPGSVHYWRHYTIWIIFSWFLFALRGCELVSQFQTSFFSFLNYKSPQINWRAFWLFVPFVFASFFLFLSFQVLIKNFGPQLFFFSFLFVFLLTFFVMATAGTRHTVMDFN